MPEGLKSLTKQQQKSFINTHLLHLAEIDDETGWEPLRVEALDEDTVKVEFSGGDTLSYRFGDWW